MRKPTKKDYIEIGVSIIVVILIGWCCYHKGYDNGFDDCTNMFINR